MFNLFRKKPGPGNSFPLLEKSPLKDKYFRRNALWGLHEPGKIYVEDPKQPRRHLMDEWPQTVFLEAEGQRTVAEYVAYMADQYGSDKVPATLDKIILDNIDILRGYGLIVLSEQPLEMPYYFSDAKERLDPHKAEELMWKDGLID